MGDEYMERKRKTTTTIKNQRWGKKDNAQLALNLKITVCGRFMDAAAKYKWREYIPLDLYGYNLVG